MERLKVRITIGTRVLLKQVSSIEVVSSWATVTDTARVVLPRNLNFNGQPLVGNRQLFQGQTISIQVGYNSVLETLFIGYISKIKPETPVELECEDIMYFVKRKSLNKVYNPARLTEVLGDLFDGVRRFNDQDTSESLLDTVAEFNLGELKLKNAGGGEVIQTLAKEYKVFTWARADKVYSPLAYVPELQRTFGVWLSGDRCNVKGHSLEYRRAKDMKVQIEAFSIRPDNTRITVLVGDPDGAKRQIPFYDIGQAALEEAANRELERLRFDGYEGTVTLFGGALVQHGDLLEINDPYHPDRAGKFVIDQVTTTVGSGGISQVCKIGRKFA